MGTTTTTTTTTTWATTTTTTTTSCTCSDSTFSLSGATCYHVSTATTNWAGAVTACQGMGANLATIEDSDLDAAITAEMSGDIYIGLNDPTKAKSWEWSETSAALGSYTNWYGSNPGSVA